MKMLGPSILAAMNLAVRLLERLGLRHRLARVTTLACRVGAGIPVHRLPSGSALAASSECTS